MKYLIVVFLLFSLSGYAQNLEVLLDSAIHSNGNHQTYFLKAKALIKTDKEKADYLFAIHGHYSKLNNRDSMLVVEKELFPLLDSFADRVRKTAVLVRIGYYYETAGLYDQTIQYYLEAMEEILPTKRPDLISDTYRSLSQVHRLFHDYDQAVFYGKKAFEAIENEQDTFLTIKTGALNIIGGAFSEKNMPDSTLFYYSKVMDFVPPLDSMDVAATIVNMGYAYLLKGDIEKSREYNKAGLDLYKNTDNDYATAIVFINSGMTENVAKNYKEALSLLDSGIFYTKKSQYAELYTWIYDEQAKIYKAIGKYPEAIKSMENLLTIKDSLFATDRAKVAKDLETKYQTTIKDQQIKENEKQIAEKKAELQRVIILSLLLLIIICLLIVVHFLNKNRFEKKQQILEKEKEISVKEAYLHAALESQETERKRFAQDLHDGFGQLISALQLNIQQLKMDKNHNGHINPVERTETILKEMHSEIRNISFNLMPATLIQSGLKDAIREFAGRINASGFVQIEVDTHGMDHRLTETQEISLYRVIQEWVNNVIKYAEATTVNIQMVRHEDEVSIVMEDDGMGFDASILEKGNGNGWRNIQSRLQLINASWELDTLPNRQGSTFILSLPLPVITEMIIEEKELT
jgi:signal transduction histidine kinase